MKKYTYLNTSLFRSGAVQLYRVFDTEENRVYFVGISEGKGRSSRETFEGTRTEVNRWRQSMGAS